MKPIKWNDVRLFRKGDLDHSLIPSAHILKWHREFSCCFFSAVTFSFHAFFFLLCSLQKTRGTLRSSAGHLCGSWKKRIATCAPRRNVNVKKRSCASNTPKGAGVSGGIHPPLHMSLKAPQPGKLHLPIHLHTYRGELPRTPLLVDKWPSELICLDVSMFGGMYVPLYKCGWPHKCILLSCVTRVDSTHGYVHGGVIVCVRYIVIEWCFQVECFPNTLFDNGLRLQCSPFCPSRRARSLHQHSQCLSRVSDWTGSKGSLFLSVSILHIDLNDYYTLTTAASLGGAYLCLHFYTDC